MEPRGEGKELRNRYEGEWLILLFKFKSSFIRLNGERQGFGIFYYANGSKYEGEWKHNLKDGFAIFTKEDGTIVRGRFK